MPEPYLDRDHYDRQRDLQAEAFADGVESGEMWLSHKTRGLDWLWGGTTALPSSAVPGANRVLDDGKEEAA